MYPDYSSHNLPFGHQLAYLLAIDIIIGFVYGLVPATFTPLRMLLALVQLGFMALTMWITIQRVLEDY